MSAGYLNPSMYDHSTEAAQWYKANTPKRCDINTEKSLWTRSTAEDILGFSEIQRVLDADAFEVAESADPPIRTLRPLIRVLSDGAKAAANDGAKSSFTTFDIVSSVMTSPAFSFSVAFVAGVVSAVLYVVGQYLPILAFGVASVSFILLGAAEVAIKRTLKRDDLR